MATLILSAVGASFGSALGTGFLGVAGAAIGQAAGAAIGRSIDERLLGSGSQAVEVGRVDRFRLMGASEGAVVPRVWGRFRVGGQVIWASRFREDRNRRSSGKGGGRKTTVTEFSYSVSLAIAVCEGPIRCVGRVWADGNEIAKSSLTLRVYEGAEDQLPDPLIDAVEGAGSACAFRGTAYVVIEDLDLGRFGNRVPQFSFEVVRSASGEDRSPILADSVKAVAMIPGTGEYALATSAVNLEANPGASRTVNVNTAEGLADMTVSLSQLRGELPNVKAVSLVVSWFGDDLRCGSCSIRPKVEQKDVDGRNMKWRAGGIERKAAQVLPMLSGGSVYGGTPADQSVIEAIRAIKAGGQEVMFYPFVLMEILAGNGKPDPWSPGREQPQLPWRGRITLNRAPGVPGTPDGTSAAEAEVVAFFGTATRTQFTIQGGKVAYHGPDEWGYRRFILHYAHLCALAGGVDAFCIGSELRGLTRIRGQENSFPAVRELIELSDEVRAILGSATKLGYAADWSEYANYQLDGNLYFHLDPLWAHGNIDFVGIDNYLPLSDWRDTDSNVDRAWGSCSDLNYLYSNVAGGEWFDWYYDSEESAQLQRRVPIFDGAFGEHWAFRVKDIRGWWGNLHFDRISGERRATEWNPGLKPIWFTEYGCPAVEYGTNQPNVFVDPRSSESMLPRGSSGARDDFIQLSYFAAMAEFWARSENNPISSVYGGAMVDMSHAFAWAWDARPFPSFPTRGDLWSDGPNYELGHWLNGRSGSECVRNVVGELSASVAGNIDLTNVPCVVRGYMLERAASARAGIQPLMLAFGFDVIERDGDVQLRQRAAEPLVAIDPVSAVVEQDLGGFVERSLGGIDPDPESLIITYVRDQGSFETSTAHSLQVAGMRGGLAQSEVPLVLTQREARAVVERWQAEMRLGRETVKLSLPMSSSSLGPGDTVRLGQTLFRIGRVERSSHLFVEGERTDPTAYEVVPSDDELIPSAIPDAGTQPEATFLDLPLIRGDEVPHAPYVAVAAMSWPGPVAVWDASGADGFELNTLVASPAIVGVTRNALDAAQAGLPDRGTPLRVAFSGGDPQTASWDAVLSGANLAAIGTGAASGWEIFQFAVANAVGPGEFELSVRLRGQLGTESDMPKVWPPGSLVVIIDSALKQIEIAPNQRGLSRTYRIGTAALGYADVQAETRIESFSGNGLRPYGVTHLGVQPRELGGVTVRWTRRTRIEGDSWDGVEVPLAEEREWYVVRVYSGEMLLRETQVSQAEWIYPPELLFADSGLGGLSISVAQGSARFGLGPFTTVPIPVWAFA